MANIVEQMTAEYNPVNRNAKLSTIMEKWSRTGLLKKLDDEQGSSCCSVVREPGCRTSQSDVN